MVAAPGLIIAMVILHKLRCILRQWVDHAAGKSVAAVFVVLDALDVHRLFLCVTGIGGVFAVKISIGVHTSHIIHGHGSGCLNAGIHSSGIDCHAAPAANADDTDAVGVNIFLHGQKIHRGTEIFRVDVRGCHITGTAAAFAGKGRVKGDGQESKLRHCLSIQPGRLLLHRAKRTADRNG